MRRRRAPVRGFASRQLLAGRDPTLRFYNGATKGMSYSTGDEAMGDVKRYWSIDLETGVITELASMFPGIGEPSTTTTTPRFRCAWTEGDGVKSVVITDTQTNQQVTIDGVVLRGTSCPTEAKPTLTHWRRADSGQLQLWTGPFDAMVLAPLDFDLAVIEVVPVIVNGATTVIAGTPAQPEAAGIYTIDMTSFAVTEVIPAALASGAWAAGAVPALDSSLVSTRVAVSMPTPTGGFATQDLYNGRFLYQREMADGGTTVFIGPFADGPARELALFRLDPDASLARLGVVPAQQMAWRQYDETLAQVLHVFDHTRRQLATCVLSDAMTQPLDALAGAATADGASVLFTPQPFNPDYDISQTPGPVLLVSPAAAAAGDAGTGCTTLAASSALAGGVSSDRTTLFWLLAPPEETDTQLWAAAADGSGRRLLGAGPILGPPHEPYFVGDSRLQLTLGRDLTWLDVRDDPVHMHYITEQAFGTAIDVGDWLVTGHSYSDQDATGRLSVINRQTGRTLPISPEVDLYTSPDVALQRYEQLPADRVVHVAYVVRGRNPSPQDGLWLATIDGAALPSR